MLFDTDDADLSLTLTLTDEPDGVDLTADGLGAEILAQAVDECHRSALDERAPDGEPWAPLKSGTVHAKPGLTKYRIGVRSGAMLDPARFDPRSGTVTTRSATWSYPKGPTWDRAHGFQVGRPNVQEARPIVGWTPTARARAAQLIERASRAARFAEGE